jgi:F-type H+-transporting ATPase subunit epsilon
MTLHLQVLTSNGVIWNSEAQEVILSTNSGQIGILPNHAPLLTGLDIGVLKARIDNKLTALAVLGGFAQIDNNRVTVLVNDAEKASDIDLEEAQSTFTIAKVKLDQAQTRKTKIEATLGLKRAKARLEAVQAIRS